MTEAATEGSASITGQISENSRWSRSLAWPR